MHKPDKVSRTYLYIVFITASLIGWITFLYSRPLIVETACSEIASRSKTFSSKQMILNPDNTYENLKLRCMNNSLSAK